MQAVGLDAAGGDGAARDACASGPAAFEFVLRRNCSLSPRGLIAVFSSLVVLSFAFGAGFAALGAWMILPFAGVELLALAAAFVVYAAHAVDGERVRVAGDVLTVEVTQGSRSWAHTFPTPSVRLVWEAEAAPGRRGWAGQRRLYLVSRGHALEVARHLGAQRRAGFELEVRAALVRARRSGQGWR